MTSEEKDLEYIWDVAKAASLKSIELENENAILKDKLRMKQLDFRKLKVLYKRLYKLHHTDLS